MHAQLCRYSATRYCNPAIQPPHQIARHYTTPTDKGNYKLSVLVVADAFPINDVRQLGVITELLVVPMNRNYLYHVVSWMSHKAKDSVKGIPAAEVFAAVEGIDDSKIACNAYNK